LTFGCHGNGIPKVVGFFAAVGIAIAAAALGDAINELMCLCKRLFNERAKYQ